MSNRYVFPGHRPFAEAVAARLGTPPEKVGPALNLRPLTTLASLVAQASDAAPAHRADMLGHAAGHQQTLDLAAATGRAILAEASAAFGLEPPDVPNPEAADLRKQLAEREAAWMTERDRLAARVAELEWAQTAKPAPGSPKPKA